MSRLLPLLLTALVLCARLPAEELRAAWVASVVNLNFPSKAGLSPAEQQAEIERIVSTAASRGLNALMVQVRPEGDALYQSRYEPWSRYLTGTQGAAPGYDPLAAFLAAGRRHGIAIHAWLNPYRGALNGSLPRAGNHPTQRISGAVRRVGSKVWLDPSDTAVRGQVLRVVQDLLSRYDVAGIVLDDYFYPYPGSGLPRGTFPDDANYAAYRAAGGEMERGDWRRANVNALIRDLRQTINATRPGVRFGVSPFGIYRPGVPAGVEAGVDMYGDIYADPVRWMREGWIDYLSPQLYWADGGKQSYSALLRWWRSSEANPRGVPIIPSLAIDRLASHRWPADEIARQLSLEKSIGPRRGGGFILWSIGPLLRDLKGVGSIVRSAGR
ncbi:MAG: family 10 glycosylhydrolase [Verrucomicrobia bacterium]|nr:family 10 glycosylhydrolase [Verrucomicrobiota bacterium]